jgi:hypothetical protein
MKHFFTFLTFVSLCLGFLNNANAQKSLPNVQSLPDYPKYENTGNQNKDIERYNAQKVQFKQNHPEYFQSEPTAIAAPQQSVETQPTLKNIDWLPNSEHAAMRYADVTPVMSGKWRVKQTKALNNNKADASTLAVLNDKIYTAVNGLNQVVFEVAIEDNSDLTIRENSDNTTNTLPKKSSGVYQLPNDKTPQNIRTVIQSNKEMIWILDDEDLSGTVSTVLYLEKM